MLIWILVGVANVVLVVGMAHRRRRVMSHERARALDLARGEMSRHTASVLLASAIKEPRRRR